MRTNNYHIHTHQSNINTPDSIITIEDIAKRAKELGHTTLSTVEHGYAGNIYEKFEIAYKYDLKLVFGVEFYYVNDRHQKDNTNSHLVILARNIQGMYEINSILSEASRTGFYYHPRIDKELLLKLNPKNVLLTTACLGSYIGKCDDYEENFIKPLYKYFKDSFYLEIQDKMTHSQAKYNKTLLQLHNKYGIKLIHGCDSHYINAKDMQDRKEFLDGKGIIYEHEEGFILDYPCYDDILKRYKKQNALTESQVKEALNNTLIIDEFEPIIFDRNSIKMPSIYPNKSHKEKMNILKNTLVKEWNKDKQEIKENKHHKYKEAIKFEVDIIDKTKMEDYFLLNYKIIKKATEEKNGVLSPTGRGSAPSFYINKLLGFTKIDRIDSPIPLYPTRFMSISRILETGSLPDIDFNTANPEPFIEASKEILGNDNIYYMVAFGTMQESEAFRNLCRAKKLNFEEYNLIAKDLDSYRDDKYWGEIIKDSQKFIGVIDSVSPSPCSFLLLDKPISKEIGLIKVGNEICCAIDGYIADKFKFLKNDFLTVKVWQIISETFDLINKPIPSIRDLKQLLTNKVWRLYSNGLTATLNQVDSDFATNLVAKYEPKSIGEMAMFVAAIRPGFASLLNTFLNREKYTTDIKELDELLKDSNNFMLFQESIMRFLIWCGIHEDETYGIIKKISKKKFKEKELQQLKEKLSSEFENKTGSKNGFDKIWRVVEDAARYSFNASHGLAVGLDSCYGGYLKAFYPLEYYTVILNKYEDNTKETSKIFNELKQLGIKVESMKFRKSKSRYSFDKNLNRIYKGLKSVKHLNSKIAEELYQLKDNKYNTFVDLLIDIKEQTSINSRQLDILTKLNFFSEFGKSKKLLIIIKYFDEFYNKKQIKKDKVDKLRLDHEIFKKYSRETEKTYMDFQSEEFLKYMWNQIEDESISIRQQCNAELEYLGYIQTVIPNVPDDYYFVKDINTKYTPKIKAYKFIDGSEHTFKIYKKKFKNNTLEVGDIIRAVNIEEKGKPYKDENGEWQNSETEMELILLNYNIVGGN